MESANGVLSLPSYSNFAGASPQLGGKRKRAESVEPAEQMNGTVDSKSAAQLLGSIRNSQQQITDFVEALKSHDTSPSILKRELLVRESSAEPHSKRSKGDPNRDTSTILTRVTYGLYIRLEDVLSDVQAACSAMLEELHVPSGAARTQYSPMSSQVSELASKVKFFQSAAETIVKGENTHSKRRATANLEQQDATRPLMNGSLPTNGITHLAANPGDNKLVITLFGNAPGPKQLFSSLQQPVKAGDGETDITLPLREAGLPNGISTTQIVPLQTSGLVEDKKRTPTMGELFTNSSSVLPFQPPKPSQIASTRSSIVGWYQPTGVDKIRSRNSQSYFDQNITCGQWLDYTGASSSLEAKRKQRERALSLGGVKVPVSSSNSAEQEASKIEALFRSAYSGFAPVRDDAAAIVPTGLANRIWWQRLGEKSFERLVHNTSNMQSIDVIGGSTTGPAADSEGKGFAEIDELEKAVQDWDESVIDPSLEQQQDMPKPIQDKDVEEILQEISELLETLNSYQRIRNLTLNPPHRSGGTNTATEPAKLSEPEIATYSILKSQLTLMIAMLPPYAVAKLNSDQLAELNISTKIQLSIDNYKGVMEEDEAAARAKVAEMRAATSARPPSSTSLHRNSSSSLYGNQYSSSTRPTLSSGQYYPQVQTPVRPPSTSLQRPPATAPAPYPGQRQTSSTSFRPQTTFSTPTYPHQLPRSSQTSYSATPSQQYFQTPTAPSYSQAHSQSYGSVPLSTSQANLSARYQPSSQTAYQQNRPQSSQNGLEYRYSNGNLGRQTSPQKPQPYNTQPQVGQTHSRSYGTPTPSVGQDHRYFQPPTTNGTSVSPQPQVSQNHQPQLGALGATGYHTVMTPEQQSSMMERQRAQLAQQQGTQQHARNAAQAGAMSVSSGTQVNGGSAVAAGL